MCAQFAIDAVMSQRVSALVCIQFAAEANADIRLTQQVATLADPGKGLVRLNTQWGIQPEWATKAIINAQSEMAATKRTLAKAFAERRCLVPCSGWYEWRDEGGPANQKYLFSQAGGDPIFIGGIWFHGIDGEMLLSMVILTIHSNPLCGQYHNRMPLLIHPNDINYWHHAASDQVALLLGPPPDNKVIRVARY